MLEQDSAATLRWLSRECQRWARQHAGRPAAGTTDRWWAGRAASTGQLLEDLRASTQPGMLPG
jgi:hypothetical protein